MTERGKPLCHIYIKERVYIMKLKLFIMILFAAAALSATVSADGLESSVEKDFSENRITVCGKSTADDTLTLEITPQGVDTDKIWDSIPDENKEYTNEFIAADPGDLITFVDTCKSDENGEFLIDARIEESGRYNIILYSQASGVRRTFDVNFVSREEYESIITLLNEHRQNQDDFFSVIKDNAEKLEIEAENDSELRKISDIIFAELGNTELTADNYEENRTTFTLCSLIAALNDKRSFENAQMYIKELIAGTDTAEVWEKYITEPAYESYLMTKLQGMDIKNINDLKEKTDGAIVLTVVRYPDGYSNIKTIFETYKGILGISAVSSNNTVYQRLAGNDYENIAKLAAAYDSFIKAAASQQGSSSSGGGGRGGYRGQAENSSGIVASDINDTEDERESVNNMTFTDLDTVMWAYEAISALADKGIISGRSETQFAPRDNIKREEFAKLVLGLTGEEADTATNIFSDVDDDAWFCAYVNKAYEMGIVKGIGDNMFGAGENITRQDIAVMIYNVLKYENAAQSGEADFADSDMIADYAKEAVGSLAGMGIINGYEDGTFDPTGYATRAEAAQMIFSAYKVLN